MQTCSLSIEDIPGEQYDALIEALAHAGLEAFGPAVVKRRFDHKRFYAYHQEHRDVITDRDVDAILDETVTYSLVGGKV